MKTLRELLLSKERAVVRFEAELLLAHALKKTRTFVVAHPEACATKNVEKRFASFLDRRTRHEPISLIVGKKEFYGREFLVNRHTLVPRPETELLVEAALELIFPAEELSKKNISEKRFEKVLVIDVGTGSGNIIVTIAKELEQKKISRNNVSLVAVDISKDALVVARKNASRHATKKQIRFFQSDLLKNIPEKFFRDTGKIFVIANLPYLSTEEYENAPPDVRNFEPLSALESGPTGLDHCQKLFETLKARFSPLPITMLLEISSSQKTALESLISDIFPKAKYAFHRDLAHKWRLVRIDVKNSISSSQKNNVPKKSGRRSNEMEV